MWRGGCRNCRLDPDPSCLVILHAHAVCGSLHVLPRGSLHSASKMRYDDGQRWAHATDEGFVFGPGDVGGAGRARVAVSSSIFRCAVRLRSVRPRHSRAKGLRIDWPTYLANPGRSRWAIFPRRQGHASDEQIADETLYIFRSRTGHARFTGLARGAVCGRNYRTRVPHRASTSSDYRHGRGHKVI